MSETLRPMTRLGKLWTASIAYVALAVGAGLSIMYNVVDTMTVRGDALDAYDVITAIAAPGVVVLMVEMFVARIWVGQPWHIQSLRWLATLAIGGVAMRTSWTHGHDFMARRGQSADVASLWPLAIDLLAIMATALILAGRRPVANPVANGQDVASEDVASEDVASEDVASEDVAKLMAMQDRINLAKGVTGQATGWPDEDDAIPTAAELNQYMATVLSDEASSYLARLAEQQESAPLPQRKRTAAKYDRAAAVLAIQTSLEAGSDGPQVDAAVAEAFGISTRTARRLRAQVSGEPVSGPPSDGDEN